MHSDNQEKNYTGEEISFKDVAAKFRTWYSVMRNRWKTILVFCLAGGLLGLCLSYFIPHVYRADLTFVLANNDKGKLSGYSGLAAQFGLSLGGGGSVFQEDENIMALMKSRTMITRTLVSRSEDGRSFLADRYIKAMGLAHKWRNHPTLSSISFDGYQERPTLLQDSVLSLLHKLIITKNLSVAKPDNKVDIIAVSTSSTDELFAKNFTEKLLQNVSGFYIETQTKKSQENVMILRHQADSVRGLLNSALTGVAVSSDANPNMNPALKRLMVPSQRRMVDVEMNKAILEELVKNLEIAEIGLRKETPLVQVIDSPVLPLEYTRLSKLKGIVFGILIGGVLILGYFSLRLYLRAITS